MRPQATYIVFKWSGTTTNALKTEFRPKRVKEKLDRLHWEFKLLYMEAQMSRSDYRQVVA